jgi:hypothetical protein
MDRRRFVSGAVGVSVATAAGPWIATARAASEDEIAYANFGTSTEFLVKDFYSKAIEAKQLSRSGLAAAKRGRAAAGHHARALADLLADAGDAAPLERTSSSPGPRRRSVPLTRR